MIFTLSSVPLYLSIPSFIDMVVENGESLPIYGFVGSSVLCISMMGGTYAILPAYEADLYGAKVFICFLLVAVLTTIHFYILFCTPSNLPAESWANARCHDVIFGRRCHPWTVNVTATAEHVGTEVHQ